MNDQISELERRLADVRSMVDQEEEGLTSSETPRAARIFLGSLSQQQKAIEHELHLAKAERAHEVLHLRLHGTLLSDGTIPLRLLAKISNPLNAAIETAAWRVWDTNADTNQIDDQFIRLLDLRLAGLESGSTELLVMGNLSPDLTGESALDVALRRIFSLFSSVPEELPETLNEIGIKSGRHIGDLMLTLERENIAVDAYWHAPDDHEYMWQGRPSEITRLRVLLEEIGEPEVSIYPIAAEVHLLSTTGRIGLRATESGQKLNVSFARALKEEVGQLRLGDKAIFELEQTTYPLSASRRKKDTFRLLSIQGSVPAPVSNH